MSEEWGNPASMRNRNWLLKKVGDWYKAPLPKPKLNITRKGLGPFVRGYLKALLDTAEIDDPDNWGEFIDVVGFQIEDIQDPYIVQAISDCTHFYWRNRVDLEDIWANNLDYDQFKTGRDFYLARIGRQSFSLRGYEVVWDRLQSNAQFAYGPVRLGLEDGQIKMLGEGQ